MNDLRQTLKAGTFLVIETGEYSDRSWGGPVRMLKDATKGDLAEAFQAEWKPNPDYDWQLTPEPSDFLPWLVKAGWAEDVPNVESWHVGSYGRFEPA